MALGVNDFKQKLAGGGARANLFQCFITFPGYSEGDTNETSFLCKTAQLPASTVGSFIVNFRGRELKMASERTFEPWTVTILNDTNFNIRNAMERWSNGINGHALNTGLTNPEDYQTDITVNQLDRDESIIKSVVLRGAFPESVGPIELSYDTRGEIETFDVTFAYQWWEGVATGRSKATTS